MIASPNDVLEERSLAKKTVEDWNLRRSSSTAVVFLPLMWEYHTIPEQGERAQAIVNKQMLGRADALLAVFGTRLGTPTGVAESGTAEEIKEFKDAGKHVAIYFSTRPIDPYKNNPDEFARLKAFREWCMSEGLIDEFPDHAKFVEKILNLLEVLASRFSPQGGQEAPPKAKLTRDTNLRREFKQYMDRASATWEVERESEAYKLDDAKRILRGIADNAVRVVTSLSEKTEPVVEAAKKLAVDARLLEQHRLYMDGGQSYREFWKLGNEIVKRACDMAEH
jgi:hypothetical protein